MELKEGERAEILWGDKIIIQNERLYRFTSDSILLSRFVKGKKGEVAADFCSGSGVVGLHFLCLNPQIKSLTLFEMQEPLADACRRTVQHNGFKNVQTVNCKLQDIGAEYNGAFSLILCNPPYERGGFDKAAIEVAVCRKEITITLREIIEIASKKLKFGGRLAIVNRADRTAELIYLLKNASLEPKKMAFVSGKAGAKPYLVLVEAAKGGKEGVEIAPTITNENITTFGCD